MRRVSLLLGFVALIACGCSDSGPGPTSPNPETRGTPLGPAGTFDPGSQLLWSAATNEIVGTGAVTIANPAPGGLVALHSLLGATRVLEPEYARPPVAPVLGTPLYYQTILAGRGGTDSVVFNRVAMTGGAPTRIEARPIPGAYHYAVSGDGAWLAWSSSTFFAPSPDGMVIEHTPSGSRTRIGPGLPVLMSPDGSQLLYRATFGVGTFTQYDRITDTHAPFDIGLPLGASEAVLRWDLAGVHAIYAQGQQLWVRHVTTGIEELLYESGDLLLGSSGSWSPDGSHVATWGDTPVEIGGTTHVMSVHIVDVASRSGLVVATGEVDFQLGPAVFLMSGIVFSPDSRTVAYQYGTQTFTAMVPGATPANRAR